MDSNPLEGRKRFNPPPLISQNFSNKKIEIIEEKIKKWRQKINLLDKKIVKWISEGLLIGWNDYSGMSDKEIKEVMKEQGFSEKEIDDMIEKLWELQLDSDKYQNDILTR